MPIESKGNVPEGGTFESCRIDSVPICPVHAHFEVPFRRWTERNASHYELRKIKRRFRSVLSGCFRFDSRATVIVDRCRADPTRAKSPLLARLPSNAELGTDRGAVAGITESVAGNQADTGTKFNGRIVESRPGGERKTGKNFDCGDGSNACV